MKKRMKSVGIQIVFQIIVSAKSPPSSTILTTDYTFYIRKEQPRKVERNTNSSKPIAIAEGAFCYNIKSPSVSLNSITCNISSSFLAVYLKNSLLSSSFPFSSTTDVAPLPQSMMWARLSESTIATSSK